MLSPRPFSVLRYIAESPEHAHRIAISDEEAIHVERVAQNLIAQAIEEPIMVYS